MRSVIVPGGLLALALGSAAFGQSQTPITGSAAFPIADARTNVSEQPAPLPVFLDFGLTANDFGVVDACIPFPGAIPLDTQYVNGYSIVFGDAVDLPTPPTVIIEDSAFTTRCRSSGTPAFETDWWCQFKIGQGPGVPGVPAGVPEFIAEVGGFDSPIGTTLMEGYDGSGNLIANAQTTVSSGSEFLAIGAPPGQLICFVRVISSIDVLGLSVDLLSYPDPAPKTCELYSISSGDPLLRLLNPLNAATIAAVPIVLPGEVVTGGNGLATHPVTGQLWAVLKLTGQFGRELVTVDPLSGLATRIGNTGDRFSALAFDSGGELYGVTGDGAAAPETLYLIDTTTAVPAFVRVLGNGDDGEALAFHPRDGRLYHASGLTNLVFESIDLVGYTLTNIPIGTPPLGGEANALTAFCPVTDSLFWARGAGTDDLLQVTTAGVATFIGPLDHRSKGLAVRGACNLFSVTSTDDQLRRIDPSSASTVWSVPITVPGEVVTGATGLATHPLTGELYALVKLSGQVGRELVVLEPATGYVAVRVGDTGDRFAGLAFDSAGDLLGVTGDGGLTPESLFVISTVDATTGFVLSLGNGDDGEALAFNPFDGLFYHASGLSTVIFESVDLSGPTVTNIPIATPPAGAEASALTLVCPPEEAFLWARGVGGQDLFRVTKSGLTTLVGVTDHRSKGLAVASAPVCKAPASAGFRNGGTNPASYSSSLITLGGVAFMANVDNNLAGQVTSALFAFDTPISFTLGGGQTLLSLDVGGSGELFSGAGLAPVNNVAGVDYYLLSIPNRLFLCGMPVHSQAIQFGNPPYVLSNAMDFIIGL